MRGTSSRNLSVFRGIAKSTNTGYTKPKGVRARRLESSFVEGGRLVCTTRNSTTWTLTRSPLACPLCDIIEESENDPSDDSVLIGESTYLQDSAIPGAHQCGNKCGDGQLSPSKEEGIYILPRPLIKTKPQCGKEVDENEGLG